MFNSGNEITLSFADSDERNEGDGNLFRIEINSRWRQKVAKKTTNIYPQFGF